MSLLAECSTILAASLDYEATLQTVARLSVPQFADVCVIFVYDHAGNLHVVQSADPMSAEAKPEPLASGRGLSQGVLHSHIANVIQTGKPLIFGPTPTEQRRISLPDSDYLPPPLPPGPQSAVIVPMVARGRSIGAIAFVTQARDRYRHDDVILAVELSRRAAQAVDNAQLHQAAADAERGLRYQLDVTTAITSSLDEGLVVLDRDLRLRHVNPAAARMFGANADSCYGRPGHQFLSLASASGEPIPMDRHPISTAMQKRMVVSEPDALLRRRDGAPLAIAYRASPLVIDHTVTGVVFVMRDNTQRKRAEDADRQLRQAASLTAMGLLGSSVIHDLAQPVAAVTAMMEVLSEEEQLTPHGRELVDRIQRTLRRVGETTLHLRRFMRVADESVSSVDLTRICDDALQLLERDFHIRGINVERDWSAQSSLVRGNADELEQVIVNILANARDAMAGRAGAITIRTESLKRRGGGRMVALRVRDEGGGIPLDLQHRVFEPLFTTKERDDGAGLGLAICKRIVEHLGGSIDLESTEGQGTCVSVLLPEAE